jgi:hypothetical protein
VTALEADLAEAKREAARSFQRGVKSERDLNKLTGSTFGNGYKAAFEGWDWNVDSWYIIKIGKGETGPFEIASQYEFDDCLLTYRRNESIFTRPNDYPC